PELRNSKIQDFIECVDGPLDCAALCNVNKRIACHREYVSRADDVGIAEVNNRVTVRVRCRRVEQLDALAAKESIPLILRHGLRGPTKRPSITGWPRR